MEIPRHRLKLEVAFGDTDASGWVHFPNIFRYVEAAEHNYLRLLGVVVFDREVGGWPRVNVFCDFKKPLMTGDQIEVLIDITRIGAASITWDFEVLNAAGEIAATGNMTTVRVNEQGRPTEISADERVALGFPPTF